MMRNLKKFVKRWTVLSIATASLSACATIPLPTVKVYDKVVCGDLGVDGAHCNHTYTKNQSFDLTKKQWDAQRVGWMCMHHGDFEDTEGALDQLCLNTDKCDYRVKEAILIVKAHLRSISEKASRAERKAFYMGLLEGAEAKADRD